MGEAGWAGVRGPGTHIEDARPASLVSNLVTQALRLPLIVEAAGVKVAATPGHVPPIDVPHVLIENGIAVAVFAKVAVGHVGAVCSLCLWVAVEHLQRWHDCKSIGIVLFTILEMVYQ